MVWLVGKWLWWVTAWLNALQPVTRSSTQQRDTSLEEKPILMSKVPQEQNQSQIPASVEPITREYKKSNIDYSLQDIDWKIGKLKDNVFSLWKFSWINQNIWATPISEWLKGTNIQQFSPEQQQNIKQSIVTGKHI